MRAAPLCELLKIFIFYPNMQTVLVHLPPKSKYSQIGYKSVLLPHGPFVFRTHDC